MKHTLKILIPILLILALLIGACYFFLIARRDLTESVFTYWGNHFITTAATAAPSPAASSPCTSPRRTPSLPSGSRAACKRAGYTSRIYPRQRHHAEPPTAADLYIALSKTYVEQDKLPDAETMLGRITNDAVPHPDRRPAPRRTRDRAGERHLYGVHRCHHHRDRGHRLRRLQQRFPGRGDGHLYWPHLPDRGREQDRRAERGGQRSRERRRLRRLYRRQRRGAGHAGGRGAGQLCP